MGSNAVSCRAAGSRRGKAPHAVAAAVAAVIVLTGTACSTQTYMGKPVLTWWQGPPELGAVSGGTDYIYNDRYHQIAEVKGGNGYSADGQEFLITPWNTALIIADTITTANLTSIGGPADQKVVDTIVQEIDISTGTRGVTWNA